MDNYRMSLNGNDHWDLSAQALADGCAGFSASDGAVGNLNSWQRQWDSIPFKISNGTPTSSEHWPARSDDWLNHVRRTRNTYTISGILTHDFLLAGDVFEIDFRSKQGKEITLVVEVDSVSEWYMFWGISVSSIENQNEIVRLCAPSTTLPLPIYFWGRGHRDITKYYRDYIDWPNINESDIIGIVLHRKRLPIWNRNPAAIGAKTVFAGAAVAALDRQS